MYVNLKLLSKALFITFFARPPRLRRWGWTLGVGIVFAVIWCAVALGRLLDRVFFPGFRQQPIREPVFIVGAPRSGTTFMQSLMSLDRERFTHLKLYQTIFPSVVYQRCFDFLGRVDARSGGLLSRLPHRIERHFFGAWDDMHRLAFDRPEEDEGLFVYTLMTESIYLLFPYVAELPEAGFPDRLPAKSRHRLMRYYASCLRRHLYATGPEKTLLSKSTSFAGRIDSMLERFPDARVVHLVRHPDECIPSHVSVFYPAWRAHSPEIRKDSPESRAYAQLAVDWYRNMFEKRHKFSEDRYVCLRYEEFVADPQAAVARIYAHFDFEMSDAFRARLAQAARAASRRERNHIYSLEEYGLSRAWIRERLGDVLEVYGFEA
ncbi:MAG: sulfotransferase [Myxococcales bacterium]|nr:sulfotransferase [Myxococcales bacterium]MDH5567074.1 sulfotransferase [Myxococcales bacterium]